MGNNCNFADLSLDEANDRLCQNSLKMSRGRKDNSLRVKKLNTSFPELPDLPMESNKIERVKA